MGGERDGPARHARLRRRAAGRPRRHRQRDRGLRDHVGRPVVQRRRWGAVGTGRRAAAAGLRRGNRRGMMAAATVRLPRLLLAQAGNQRTHEVEAATVLGALDTLCERLPALRVHIFERAGVPRQHVNCFHNGEILRFRGTLEIPIEDGDEIDVVQAVSGG
ncbi:MAG: hypothetical protein GEV08_08555 [Acidimicrobiia bacterium]|nr:hypothetical protein [Acidimicrobiia bacterium]